MNQTGVRSTDSRRAARTSSGRNPVVEGVEDTAGQSRHKTMRNLRVGIDVSPLELTGAGTARYLRNLLAALEREPGLELRRHRFRRIVARGQGRARHDLVPGRAAGRGAQGRRAPRPRPSRPAALARAARRHHPRPRGPPPSRGVQPLDAHVQPRVPAPARAVRDARDRRLRLHRAGGGRAARRRGGARARDPPRRRGAVRAERAGHRGGLRPRRWDARAAQEPSAGRAGRGARRRRAACRRRAGLGRGRRPSRRASSPTTSSPASTAARPASSTRRCTKASACRCSRRWPPERRW